MRPEVNALFREVADRSPEQRHEYYAREQVPEALRAEVESLLQYDTSSSDSLQGYVDSAHRLLGTETTPQTRDEPVRPVPRGLPDRISRFEVTKLLGRGGMGEVYLARDPVIDRMVAIKLIGSGLELDRGRRRLMREARAAGRLHHPNIVTVFEAGEFEDRSFIAMEYVPGETLGRLIRHRAELTMRNRLEMIEGACAGLAHAHRAGVIHLDIKPDNLMLADTGVVKVLDFGISKVLQNQTLATAQGAGTLRYMSPEQIQGKPLDHRSDVFSLGCSLFELVSYAPAFTGSTREIVTQIAAGPVPSLLDLSSDFDRRLDHIIRRSMALEPSKRYDDLEEMRADLARVRASIDPAHDVVVVSPLAEPAEDVETAAATRPVTRRRVWWRSRAAIAGGATALLVAGGATLTLWNTRSSDERAPADVVAVTPAASPPASTTPPATPPASASGEPAPAAPPVSAAPQDEVWRRLARNDRAGVLEWLETNRTDPALANAIVDTVRTSVTKTRETATASPTARSAESYRTGEEHLARATRLVASGRPMDSLRALWQAADSFTQSLSVSPAQVSAPSESPPATPAAAPSAVNTAPLPSETANLPAKTPAPTVSTAPVRPAPTPPPTAQESPAEAITNTLRRYDAAYESLDVSALLKVFPSLGRDQVDTLRRTFAGVSSYEMDTSVVKIEVNNDSATVLARVARRMNPRVGNPVVNDVENEFQLRRSGNDWVIVGVRARP